MPIKSKKSEKPKISEKPPTKKFVVEETTEDAKTSSSLPTTESKGLAEPDAPSTPNKIEENSQTTATSEVTGVKSSDQKPEDQVLNSDTEKDTLSPSITSFSLLDSDKSGKSEETTMQDKTIENPQTSQQTSDLPVKSSQDEVNKWIENYDDKDITETKKKGSGFFKTFLILLIVLSFAAIIAGGVYYYQKNIAGSKEEVAPESTEEAVVVKEAPTATPTKEPEKETVKVDYSKYSLQILNGSGVPGEAGKAKALVLDLKFKSIVTGNAANYDYETTVISLKENIPDQVFADIKEALKSTYEVESDSETLKSTSSYDVVITVGPKK